MIGAEDLSYISSATKHYQQAQIGKVIYFKQSSFKKWCKYAPVGVKLLNIMFTC